MLKLYRKYNGNKITKFVTLAMFVNEQGFIENLVNYYIENKFNFLDCL